MLFFLWKAFKQNRCATAMGRFHTVPLLLTTESCGVFNIQRSLWLLFSIWQWWVFSSEWLSVTVHLDVIHDVSMTSPKKWWTKILRNSSNLHWVTWGNFTKVTSLESLEQPLRVRWNWIQICGQHIPERPDATWLRQVEKRSPEWRLASTIHIFHMLRSLGRNQVKEMPLNSRQKTLILTSMVSVLYLYLWCILYFFW